MHFFFGLILLLCVLTEVKVTGYPGWVSVAFYALKVGLCIVMALLTFESYKL